MRENFLRSVIVNALRRQPGSGVLDSQAKFEQFLHLLDIARALAAPGDNVWIKQVPVLGRQDACSHLRARLDQPHRAQSSHTLTNYRAGNAEPFTQLVGVNNGAGFDVAADNFEARSAARRAGGSDGWTRERRR